MKDGKYLYSDLDGRVYLRIKAGSYECLTADTNTGWEEGEKGSVVNLISSMWELVEDPEITNLREQLAKANERADSSEKEVARLRNLFHKWKKEKDNAVWESDIVFKALLSEMQTCPKDEHGVSDKEWWKRYVKKALNKFATEKKLEGIDYLLNSIAPSIKMGEKCLWRFETYEVESVKDQLRKEQE
ncbi:MAG: hypothetical protein GOVbin2917_136 [Prokaryotic dsDNA virus sp.]|jgi:hypothetical protein|nr:MAG: hypothetical protein GOVbin2917_136 [Prokaryotic dsDNA virus sp.]|tara:strand:+ start:21295 stop:21855 length:561 start_codon:yes stop_codon:yes gene_type:complete